MGLALVIAITGLLLAIAKRAKATEDEIDSNALDRSNEMNIHQFLRYAGIRVGDISSEGLQDATLAIKKLEELALAGSIKVWGELSRQGFYSNAGLVPKDHWRVAFIYPPDAVEDRDPLRIRTHPREASLHFLPRGSLEPDLAAVLPDLYDHLYVSASSVKRWFKRHEFESVHTPSYRRKDNGTK